MRLLALYAALSAIVASQPAGAAEPAPSDPKNRLLVGVGLGVSDDRLSVDGRPAEGQGGDIQGGLEAGYTRDVLGRRLALAGLVRFGTFRDDWSLGAGETRQRLDLRLAPELRVRLLPGALTSDIALAAGVGPSFAFFQPAEFRELRDDYGVGTGLNLGARFLAALFSKGGHGAYMAADAGYFWLWVDRRAEVPSAGLRAVSRYRFDGFELMARAGFVTAF